MTSYPARLSPLGGIRKADNNDHNSHYRKWPLDALERPRTAATVPRLSECGIGHLSVAASLLSVDPSAARADSPAADGAQMNVTSEHA